MENNLTNKDFISAQFFDKYRDLVLGMRDLIEVLKKIKYDPLINVPHDFKVIYFNLESEKERIRFEINRNLILLKNCIQDIENIEILNICKELFQDNESLLLQID